MSTAKRNTLVRVPGEQIAGGGLRSPSLARRVASGMRLRTGRSYERRGTPPVFARHDGWGGQAIAWHFFEQS